MLRSVARRCRWAAEKAMPDAFTLTILLSLIVMLLGITMMRQTPMQMVTYWYGGFWEFLAFGMQMTLVLITGYCLAMAPPVKRGLEFVAGIPKTPAGAVTLAMGVTAAAAWLSWGLGLVLGPILAREMAKRIEVDYPLMVAAVYSAAMAILPIGLTITAPILVNTPGHFLEAQIGLIPQSETIFAPTLMVTALLAFTGAVWAFRRMLPAPHEAVIVSRADLERMESPATPPPAALRLSEKLDHSRVLTWTLAAGGLAWVIYWFATRGLDLNLNILNFAFLMLGLALHGSLVRYAEVFAGGIRSAAGIILQFPFYAGIMGMMAGSGLVLAMAEWTVAIATPQTLGFVTMISVGFINIFVPSAGGQWALQGPVLVEAARQLGVSAAVVVNGYTAGDIWTNFLQPFFALPALGISGLGLKDIWGYCLIMLVIFGLAGTVGTLLVPMLLG